MLRCFYEYFFYNHPLFFLNLATSLHAVNLCAHNDSSYNDIYAYLHDEGYPGLALNKRII